MNLPTPKRPLSRRTVIIAPAVALVACAAPDEFVPSVPGEVEATEFEGVQLTPISQMRTNALSGAQVIDPASYALTIDGLVDRPITLTYDELTAYEQQSWPLVMNCVEGWSYTAKWSGPMLTAILADAGVQPAATIAIFHTTDTKDGYTSLDLDYLVDNQIMLAMRLNDITLPNSRGFPFQVVAKAKYGYKWAKWVTRIELSDDEQFRGFWEQRGYHNEADDTGPKFS